jgi:hypothetical protein
MTIVFLSYSREDHFFADLAEIKLAESGIVIWRDHRQLRAGEEWRGGIPLHGMKRPAHRSDVRAVTYMIGTAGFEPATP